MVVVHCQFLVGSFCNHRFILEAALEEMTEMTIGQIPMDVFSPCSAGFMWSWAKPSSLTPQNLGLVSTRKVPIYCIAFMSIERNPLVSGKKNRYYDNLTWSNTKKKHNLQAQVCGRKH